MKKFIKVAMFILLFTGLGLFNIGGCGGGGGGNGGGGGGGNIILGQCPMPALNTNFGNFNYFFADITGETIGEIFVYSNGNQVTIDLTTPGLDGVLIFFADVLGPDDCSITGVTAEGSDVVLQASGSCERVAGGLQFALDGVEVGELVIPNLLGDCQSFN